MGREKYCRLRTLFKNSKNVRSKWTKKVMQAWPGCAQANKEIGHLGEAGTRKLAAEPHHEQVLGSGVESERKQV